jgi:hypothetical protein
MLKPAALPFVPANANFREGIVGAVELATGGETPTLRPPCVVTRDEGPSPTTKHTPAQSASRGIFAAVEPTDNQLCPTAFPTSTPGGTRNWSYQRVANCRYGAVEVITGHALAAAVGSAPCDRVAVQQNPRTGVDIQSYRASSRQPLCL